MAREQGVFVSDGVLTAKDILHYLAESGCHPDIHTGKDKLAETFWYAIFDDLFRISLARMARKDGKRLQFALYIADDNDNACCSKEDGFYLITVGYSILCRFAVMASHMLPVIQTPDDDSVQSKTTIELAPDVMFMEAMFNTDAPDPASIEPLLAVWGEGKSYPDCGQYLLFYDQMRLIVLHELSHCIFGHTDIYEQHIGFSTLSESDTGETATFDETNDRLRQCLEVDADWHAVSALTYQIMEGRDPDSLVNPTGNMHLFVRLAMLNLSLALFAGYWRVRGLKQSSALEILERFPVGNYPPANIRYTLMSECMFSNVAKLGCEQGLDEMYPWPDGELDMGLYTLRNQNVHEQYFSLLVRGEATRFFMNLLTVCPPLEEFIQLSGPVRVSKRLDRPHESYKSMAFRGYWYMRAMMVETTYVSTISDPVFKSMINYPQLIIFGEGDPKMAIREAFGYSDLKELYGKKWDDVESDFFPNIEVKE